MSPPSPPPTSAPLTLNIFSLNCWGLKYISKHRTTRLSEIARRIANASPLYDIVALQEFWVYDDYLTLRKITSGVLPYGKFYHSGVLGGGLVVLSRWPITGSAMEGYRLNGRPTAFWRGDWYVGKGVATARIEVGGRTVEVFNTHLHAPYEAGDDSYLCHRTTQAWQIAKLMRSAVEKGHIPIGLGDFNMIPSSLAHHIITTTGLVSDSWLLKYPSTPTSPSSSRNASYNIETLGITCDSMLNTWRMPRHAATIPGPEVKDPRAKRLDYIFVPQKGVKVVDVKVGMINPMKLPGYGVRRGKPEHGVTKDGYVSLSDHFSVELVLEILPKRQPPLISYGDAPRDDVDILDSSSESDAEEQQPSSSSPSSPPATKGEKFLSLATIREIQELSSRYMRRELWEYKWRILHFWISVPVLIALHVAVFWAAKAHPALAFMCTFLAWAVAVTGTINGLIGFLFMGSEINALKEFDEEVRFYEGRVGRVAAGVAGRTQGRVSGGVGGGLGTRERIEGELGLEGRSVEGSFGGVMRP